MTSFAKHSRACHRPCDSPGSIHSGERLSLWLWSSKKGHLSKQQKKYLSHWIMNTLKGVSLFQEKSFQTTVFHWSLFFSLCFKITSKPLPMWIHSYLVIPATGYHSEEFHSEYKRNPCFDFLPMLYFRCILHNCFMQQIIFMHFFLFLLAPFLHPFTHSVKSFFFSLKKKII